MHTHKHIRKNSTDNLYIFYPGYVLLIIIIMIIIIKHWNSLNTNGAFSPCPWGDVAFFSAALFSFHSLSGNRIQLYSYRLAIK